MLYFGRDSTLTNRLGLPKLTQLSSKSLPKQQSSYKQNESLNKRLHQLQGNLKMIQKKYKSNLKQGFDNKIKSFRLQAVIQRKMIQKSISEAKNDIQYEQHLHKNNQAQRMRHQQLRRLAYLAKRKKQESNKIHQKVLSEKKQMRQKLKEQLETLQATNKELHDKLLHQNQNKGKKKQYFSRIRQEKRYKQQSSEKNKYVQKIIHNQQELKNLENTLHQLQDKMADYRNYNHTFLTI